MFRVYLTNFHRYLDGEFATMADAIAKAKSAGFEASIVHGDDVVASWSPLYGNRRF